MACELPILEVRDLSVFFTQYARGTRQRALLALSALDLTVLPGQVVAVVGSSGSGKSLLAQALFGILPYNAHMEGSLLYQGAPLTQARIRALRGTELALVPQSVAYLDPLMKVGPQIRGGRRDRATRDATAKVLARYGLDAGTETQYPFELSGGMARRVLISTAVLHSPRLVVADEPTPGLDLKSAHRILDHFRALADGGAGVLFITHDLELALAIADRVAIFYAGTTLEEAAAADFQREDTLRHPYTKALWRAMPQNGFTAIGGTQPLDLPQGCPFAPRCPDRREDCLGVLPFRPLRGGMVRCRYAK